VYAETLQRVYARESKVNQGIHYPEVLSEELRIAWAAEGGQKLSHNSRLHYPAAVISVLDPETGQAFYVESNGASIFVKNRAGATERILQPLAGSQIDQIVGTPVIRHLALRENKLFVTIGKHYQVTYDRHTWDKVDVASD
jgi:hypothetical protein